MKTCKNCNNSVADNAVVCPTCGCKLDVANRNVAAFVLGLIGSIFGLIGGLCVSACYSFIGSETTPMIMMVGGSILGLIGCCMCFSKAKIGSLLELAGAVLIAICAFAITGAGIMSLVSIALLGIGGIVGFVTTKTN